MVKNLPVNAGNMRDAGSIPGLGRSPGEGYGKLLRYSCLENPMDRGAWQATAHGVAKSQTRLSTKHNRKHPNPNRLSRYNNIHIQVCPCMRVCVHAKSLQSYPTLCNSMDCSPPSSSVHGILQARNTGVGCHALLPGIFLTQGLNSSLISTALASKFFITRATLEAPVYSILTSSLRRSTLLSPVLTK